MNKLFEELRDAAVLPLAEAQAICFSHGISDDQRRFFWSLLLSYIPPERALREATLQAKRDQYQLFLRETEASMRQAAGSREESRSPDSRASPVASVGSPDRPGSARSFGSPLSPPSAHEEEEGRDAGDGAHVPTPMDNPTVCLEEDRRLLTVAVPASPTAGGRRASCSEGGGVGWSSSQGDGTEPLAPDCSFGDADAPPVSPLRPADMGSPSSAEPRWTPVAAHAPLTPSPTPDGAASRSSSAGPPQPLFGGPEPLRVSPLPGPSSPMTTVSYAESLLAEDAEMQAQVDKDLERTFPDLNFFLKPGNVAPMRRILVTFARLNRGLGYIQGMHELLAPLWYVFATDAERGVHVHAAAAAAAAAAAQQLEEEEQAAGAHQEGGGAEASLDGTALALSERMARARADAEADAFHCLSALMCAPFLSGEFRDLFMRASDDSAMGVKGVLLRFSSALRRRDGSLCEHLEGTLQLPAYLYAFRWISTLLVREFPFPDVIVLWDSLLSDGGKFSFLLHVCIAMLRLLRGPLLGCDMPRAMRLLRGEYPDVDLRVLRSEALAVRAEEQAELAASTAGPLLHGGPGAAAALGFSASSSFSSSSSRGASFSGDRAHPSVSSSSLGSPSMLTTLFRSSSFSSSDGGFSSTPTGTGRQHTAAAATAPGSAGSQGAGGSLASSLRRLPSLTSFFRSTSSAAALVLTVQPARSPLATAPSSATSSGSSGNAGGRGSRLAS